MAFDSLIEELSEYASDPLGFVYFAFPWGEPNSELAKWPDGPDEWQRGVLKDLGAGLLTIDEAIQLARTSGHGIGKSALVAWIILWAISTFEDTKGVVTANTENQLKTKTWAEVAKWYRMFLGKDLFKITATALFSVDPDHEKTWRIDMVPWSDKNTEAFAGLHNLGKRILVVFDEASAIADGIWEVTEGALTDQNTEIIWMAFGNPTKNSGRFRECFTGGRFAHRWNTDVVDSRSVKISNKRQINRWISDYGEDSDFVRVRVRGLFPREDATSFISLDLVREALLRKPAEPVRAGVVLGVDVARFGGDASCIYPRCGIDARTRAPRLYFGIDTMKLVSHVMGAFDEYKARAVYVDAGGVGGGVVDRLIQLGLPVFPVDFGSGADGWDAEQASIKYANKRAEIWGYMRKWMKQGFISDIECGENITLADELTGPSYAFNVKEFIRFF